MSSRAREIISVHTRARAHALILVIRDNRLGKGTRRITTLSIGAARLSDRSSISICGTFRVSVVDDLKF